MKVQGISITQKGDFRISVNSATNSNARLPCVSQEACRLVRSCWIGSLNCLPFLPRRRIEVGKALSTCGVRLSLNCIGRHLPSIGGTREAGIEGVNRQSYHRCGHEGLLAT